MSGIFILSYLPIIDKVKVTLIIFSPQRLGYVILSLSLKLRGPTATNKNNKSNIAIRILNLETNL